MKQWMDPYPPTPERFSLRVERTLQSLEEKEMNKTNVRRKLILLVAAILAALLAATAVAAIRGNSNFKARLQDEGAGEAAALVEEVHAVASGAEEGFGLSMDELVWEDSNLYVSYTLSAPEDGMYMVAMYTPTLNGEKLEYESLGWTVSKFFDGETPAVLLLGGIHRRFCNELLTFKVDPQLRTRKDNRLKLRAVLLKTEANLPGFGDWTDLLSPPDYLTLAKNWRDDFDEETLSRYDEGAQAMLDAVDAAWDGAEGLSIKALLDTGYAEYVADRSIEINLDASQMPQALYNDVAEHDFEVDGVHLHVDSFRMTHLSVSIQYTLTVPDAPPGDEDAIDRMETLNEKTWDFRTLDGKALGYNLGGWEESSSLAMPGNAPPFCENSEKRNCVVSFAGQTQIIFAPITYRNDARGNQLPPEYDMDRAIVLTPVYSEAIARAEAAATPAPTREPEAGREDDLSE